ncbi:hypothetical protein NMBM6190_1057 [Neisseria meningitidis M6190]|uniref:Uncharacterized protein n=1 Tax=Neisseria meningitidis serogroup C / serotype 2a (strain ATCC 700532 / DSM 15464 / FAM18) TaxID=272831 RepID=A1KU02_NEIMF|nr:hypothetical protein NMBM6190_1057 [Neisseria meningitidis M6190]EGC60735.1 hypothetical protein NMBES14902_1142 [Neisseria meningitidis ES14902]CAM10343.1 conserved hypothetical protein [Neisseria meningitidis FAM18]
MNIKYSGIENRFETAILKKNGVRSGFVSFAPNLAAVKLNDYAKVRKRITKTKQKADIVIVMFHGGGKGNRRNTCRSIPKSSMGKTGATSSSLHGLPSIPARMSYSGRGRTLHAPSNFTATASSLTAAATLPPTAQSTPPASAALRRFSKLSPTNRVNLFPELSSLLPKPTIKSPKSTLKNRYRADYLSEPQRLPQRERAGCLARRQHHAPVKRYWKYRPNKCRLKAFFRVSDGIFAIVNNPL